MEQKSTDKKRAPGGDSSVAPTSPSPSSSPSPSPLSSPTSTRSTKRCSWCRCFSWGWGSGSEEEKRRLVDAATMGEGEYGLGSTGGSSPPTRR